MLCYITDDMLYNKTHMLCYITHDYVMLSNTYDVIKDMISYITHNMYVIEHTLYYVI